MKVTKHNLIATIEPLIAAIGASLVDADRVKPGDVPLELDGVLIAGVRLPDRKSVV